MFSAVAWYETKWFSYRMSYKKCGNWHLQGLHCVLNAAFTFNGGEHRNRPSGGEWWRTIGVSRSSSHKRSLFTLLSALLSRYLQERAKLRKHSPCQWQRQRKLEDKPAKYLSNAALLVHFLEPRRCFIYSPYCGRNTEIEDGSAK